MEKLMKDYDPSMAPFVPGKWCLLFDRRFALCQETCRLVRVSSSGKEKRLWFISTICLIKPKFIMFLWECLMLLSYGLEQKSRVTKLGQNNFSKKRSTPLKSSLFFLRMSLGDFRVFKVAMHVTVLKTLIQQEFRSRQTVIWSWQGKGLFQDCLLLFDSSTIPSSMLKVAGNSFYDFSAFLPPWINTTTQLTLQINVSDKCSGESESSVSPIVLLTVSIPFFYEKKKKLKNLCNIFPTQHRIRLF